MNNYHRTIITIDASDLVDALQQSKSFCDIDTLTTIDMTCDFNQNRWLGQELTNVLIYFNNDSKLNGLLAVFGCVKAPFHIILACKKSSISDFFKRVILLPQLDGFSQFNGSVNIPKNQTNIQALRSAEINQAKKELLNSFGVTHLIGERGSGKSTLLGELISEKLTSFEASIILSSPTEISSKNTLCGIHPSNVAREKFRYCSPKEFLNAFQNAKWGIIDEAATFPKSIINAAISHANDYNKKLILTTTVEGYEGTGQSYRLSFLDKLREREIDKIEEKNSPDKQDKQDNEAHNKTNKEEGKKESRVNTEQIVTLSIPKRFSASDPLYQLCLSLYQPSTRIDKTIYPIKDGTFLLDTNTLRERGWTSACFALLREAHYKTTPNDLVRFYSDEALFVVKINQGEIIACAYGLPEKLPIDIISFDKNSNKNNNNFRNEVILHAYDKVKSIFYGTRRMKNAFTHQALLHAYGDLSLVENELNNTFINSKILRISRIAVAKAFRHQKTGTQLINELRETAKKKGYDFLSTSFSGSASNINFWKAQGFTPVRIGLYPNKYNDEYAVVMLNGLNDTAKEIAVHCQAFFQRHLCYFEKIYLPKYNLLLFEKQAREEIYCNPYSCNSSSRTLEEEVHSVTHYHRDINWLLPALYSFENVESSELFDGSLRGKEDIEKLESLKNHLRMTQALNPSA